MGQTQDATSGSGGSALVAFIIQVSVRWLVGFGVIGLSACADHVWQARLPKDIKVIVDVTRSTPPAQALQYYGFVRNLIDRLEDQDRVVALAITESSFARPCILLEGTIPTDDRDLKPRVLAARDSLAKQWGAIADSLVPRYQASDVFGAIEYASMLFRGAASTPWLIILSDFRNSTPTLNVEIMEAIDVEHALAQLQNAGSIPNLRGVRVAVLGLHTDGKSVRYHESMESFVLEYFKAAQADLVTIRVDLNWQPFSFFKGAKALIINRDHSIAFENL